MRGGLLLPSGTLEIDNTTSYFSSSSDHLTVDGFALLPVLVVGDIASQRLRADFLFHSLHHPAWTAAQVPDGLYRPYGYESIEPWTQPMPRRPRASSGLGDISAG